MFNRPRPKTALQKEIDRTLVQLKSHSPTTEEYGTIVDRLVKLYQMNEKDQPSSVSPDTMILVAANLLGIALIIRHEHANVITSKALGFVQKPRTSV